MQGFIVSGGVIVNILEFENESDLKHFGSVPSYIGAGIGDTYVDPRPAAEARAKRDKLLAESDWTQVLDAPVDTATRDAYRVYRQALRDVPEQDTFPDAIHWPDKPETTKAAPDPVDSAFDVLIGGDDNA